MKEKLPKKEAKSKGFSSHQEWEVQDMVFMIPLFPLFLFGSLFESLF